MTGRVMRPLRHPLNAVVRVPGSKSLTNRALAIAALAQGPTRLINALASDDARYFVQALAALGFAVETQSAATPDQPDAAAYTVQGQGGRIPATRAELFIGNAGTAARFLTQEVQTELSRSPRGEAWCLGHGWVCAVFRDSLDAKNLSVFIERAHRILRSAGAII